MAMSNLNEKPQFFVLLKHYKNSTFELKIHICILIEHWTKVVNNSNNSCELSYIFYKYINMYINIIPI